MITAADLLKAFACSNAGCECQKSLKRGKGRTHCPGHSDTNPSLDVTDMDGKVLFMCHGKCADHAATLAALQDKGFFKKAEPKAGPKRTATPKRNEIRYVVRDASGTVAAVHVRKDVAPGDKKLWWELPDGTKNLGGRKVESLPLYGSELLAQQPDEPVVITEGEKAADALRQVKVLALATVTGAASAPTVEALRLLAGRRVFLWPDADEPGRRHMEKVARRLHGLGCEVLVITWTEAPPGGDAADCPPDQLAAVVGDAEPWEPEPAIDGAKLLDELAGFLGRYVAFPSPEARDAVALWAAHTHALDCFDSTPRLASLSPEKQSGKTRTHEVLELVAARARMAASLSAAALFRLVEKEQTTLLIDEADTLFGSRATDHEELRGLLNAGHRRGAVAFRCVGDRGQEVKAFPAYAAVALAGLGELPDTILDRAVLVRMRRRAPDEVVRPFRFREAKADGSRLQERLAKWAEQVEEQLVDARPAMPEGITDRPADVWEPMLAIADTAGGEWPVRARLATVKLNSDRQAADPSLGVRLLADIRTLVGKWDRVTSAGLVERLVDLEEAPWGDLPRSHKQLDSRGLARWLKPFGIQPKQVRVGAEQKQLRGYERADFLDAWKRYLPPDPENSVTSVTSVTPSSESVTDEVARDGYEPSQDPEPSQEFELDATDVTDVTDFPEGGASSLNGQVRLEQAAPGEWRILGSPKRCCAGLWAGREAAAAHAREHGWVVAADG